MPDCRQCGECCTHMEIPVVDDKSGYWRWLSYHGANIVFSHGLFCANLEIPCEKLVDNRCSIYERRPQMCRDYKCEREDT